MNSEMASIVPKKTASSLNKRVTKESSRYKEFTKYKDSFIVEAFEKFRTRRQTVQLDEKLQVLKPTSTIYFREDRGGISCVRWSPEGEVVAVGFYSGAMKLCRPQVYRHHAETYSVLKGWEGNYSLSCLKFHPRLPELLYSSSHDGTITLCKIHHEDFSFSRNENALITEEDNEINSFDFDKEGDTIVTAGKDGTVRVYDARTCKPVIAYNKQRWSLITSSSLSTSGDAISDTTLSTLPDVCHELRIYCVKYHPEQPKIFLSGGWDHCFKIWDTRVRETCVRTIQGPFIYGESIDISRGRILTASCVAQESLQLWDMAKFGEFISDVTPTNKPVSLYGEFPYTVQFFKGDPADELVLCGGTGLGGLQIINIKESKIQHLVEDSRAIVAVDSTADAKIVFGGKSNTLVFVNVKKDSANSTMSVATKEDVESETSL